MLESDLTSSDKPHDRGLGTRIGGTDARYPRRIGESKREDMACNHTSYVRVMSSHDNLFGRRNAASHPAGPICRMRYRGTSSSDSFQSSLNIVDRFNQSQ
ncbi:hypothetical protein BC937DRAFT_86803 [Endogone sp. FLAS-F59071]|nr:hypothetical protein BC937DRAFT_86803 [Endogone sp. FLAS-F59071]|eukprot:RUS19856.1 hypothetical protein BC937DRAFT_86803 [Endogone sp. FLAS-F59071]